MSHAHAESYAPVFTSGGARRKELDELLTRYPTKMAALLPALWMVQHDRGWVSDDGDGGSRDRARPHAGVREGRGDVLHDVPPASRSDGTSSRCAPRRRATCAAPRRSSTRSSSTPAAASSAQTSPDGKFTVIEVECLGACGFATPIMINEDFIESVTPEKVPEILSGLA